jgi:hypothetical protein
MRPAMRVTSDRGANRSDSVITRLIHPEMM